MAARRNWKCPTLLLITLILWLNAAHCQQTGGNNSRKRDTCPKVVLKNGKIKLRSGGRVVKYSCNRDYVLVGESTSTCLQGEWTSEAPVCATKGCPYIPSPPSGRFIFSNGGAVMRLECNPGYRPSGSPMIYCVDKFDWNGTAPLCQASGVQQSATRCDFESDDLCGWVQDTRTDEFDWTWQNYGTPSFHLGTGPSFDHTLGQGKAGHYLFIESSSPRVLNDTARLFSPVYGQPEASAVVDEGVCFSFWFHMYGSTTGQLNVYIKPESKKMSELRPAFVRSGDQGDRWRQGYISLDTVTENFQVVIEGVRGTGYVGDSAIDDVQLTKGEECLAALKRMMADTIVPGGSTAPPSSTIPPNASCSTRCSSRTEEPASNTNTSSSSSSWTCGCSDDCLLKNSCCSDYAAFCLTGRTGTSAATATTDRREPTTVTSVTTTMASSPPQTTTITTTLAPPPSQAIASSTTTTTTEAPTIPTTTTATTFRPTAATTTMTTTTASSVPIPTTMPTTVTMSSTTPIPPTAPSTWTVIMSIVATTESTTVTSTTTTTERPTTTSTTMRPTTTLSSTTLTSTIPTTTTAKPTTTTTTTRSTTNPPTTTSTTTTTTAVPTNTFRPWVVPSTTTPLATTTTTPPPTRPTTTTSLLVTGDPPQDGLQGDDDQSGLAADQPSPSASSQTSPPKWLIGTVVSAAVGAALLLTVGVVVAVIRSRNAVSDRRRRPKLRSSQQDQLAEDSDVRYLRDEDDVQLDLTEASPSSKATGSHRQFADFERL